jgi:hypothetical protein
VVDSSQGEPWRTCGGSSSSGYGGYGNVCGGVGHGGGWFGRLWMGVEGVRMYAAVDGLNTTCAKPKYVPVPLVHHNMCNATSGLGML